MAQTIFRWEGGGIVHHSIFGSYCSFFWGRFKSAKASRSGIRSGDRHGIVLGGMNSLITTCYPGMVPPPPPKASMLLEEGIVGLPVD